MKCPKCGVTMYPEGPFTRETGESSYSFGKGVVGSLLLGPVGAVAGINGKKKKETYYICRCLKCGYNVETKSFL